MSFLKIVGMRWPPCLPPHSLMSDLEFPNLVLTLAVRFSWNCFPYLSIFPLMPLVQTALSMLSTCAWSKAHIIKCNKDWFLGFHTIPDDCSCYKHMVICRTVFSASGLGLSHLSMLLFRITAGMVPTADGAVIPLWFFSIFLSPFPCHRGRISPWFQLAGTSSSAHTDSIRGTMTWRSGLPPLLINSFLKCVVHLPPCALPTLSFLLKWGLYYNSHPQSLSLWNTSMICLSHDS